MAQAADQGEPLQLLSGPQRAAALLMALGEDDGRAVWSEFTDAEAKQVYLAMVELGSVKGETVARLADDFLVELGGTGAVTGSADRAQELLSQVYPQERATAIMAEVRGNGSRSVWRRLTEVSPESLAAFLCNEYPQTIAVIMSRLPAELGGRILALLPNELSMEVIGRVLHLDDVQPEAMDGIEEMLRRHFLTKAVGRPKRDLYDVMAERFDAFDRPTEARIFAALEAADKDAAQRIRERMFTFEDLLKLDAAGIQTVLRQVEKDTLARALKGATPAAREFFQANMSSRAAKNLQDDIDSLGPIRVADVDDAQSRIVQAAKGLAAKGEIRIQKTRADDDLVV